MNRKNSKMRFLAIITAVFVLFGTFPAGAYVANAEDNSEPAVSQQTIMVDEENIGEEPAGGTEDPIVDPEPEPEPDPEPVVMITDENGDKFLKQGENYLDGWYTDPADGKIYYFSPEDKKAVSGLQTIDGETYYFYNSGNYAASGLKKMLGDDKYFFDSTTKAAKKNYLYTTKSGYVYYFGEDGKAASGLTKVGDDKYYFFPKAKNAASGFKKIDGKYYNFHKTKKYALSGLYTINDHLYYFYKSGKHAASGLQEVGADKYYFDKDTRQAQTGVITTKGDTYYFSVKSYKALSGLRTFQGQIYYLNAATKKAYNKGWKTIDGKRYYFKSNGRAYNGYLYKNGKKYHLNNNGKDAYAMDQKAYNMTSKTKYLILLNVPKCKIGIYKGKKKHWERIYYGDMGPGTYDMPTPRGTFEVGKYKRSKSKVRYFDGTRTTYRYWYATRWYGGYMMHSYGYHIDKAPLEPGYTKLGVPVSHGCIRLPLYVAKYIYDYVPDKTKVVSYPIIKKQKKVTGSVTD